MGPRARPASRYRRIEAERQAALSAPAEGKPSRLPRGPMLIVPAAGFIVVAFGLAAVRDVVAPVVLALVLTICVHPLRVVLERRGAPRGLATGAVIVVVLLLLAAFIVAFAIALAQFVALLPTFAPQLEAAGAAVGEWLRSMGFSQEQAQTVSAGFDPAAILAFGTSLLGSVATLTGILVVVVTSLILMASDATFLGTLFEQIRTDKPRLVISLESYAGNVRRYTVVTAVLGTVQGAVNALVLVLLGVPGAFLWGLLSFLCSFIPNVGYFIAIIPPLVLGFFVGGLPTVIWITVMYSVFNGLIQSVAQPRIVGNAVALSQTLTFVSVLFWAVVLGPLGAILAVPLTLLVRAILVDPDPAARRWRPLLGDVTEARAVMKQQDELRRAARGR